MTKHHDILPRSGIGPCGSSRVTSLRIAPSGGNHLDRSQERLFLRKRVQPKKSDDKDP